MDGLEHKPNGGIGHYDIAITSHRWDLLLGWQRREFLLAMAWVFKEDRPMQMGETMLVSRPNGERIGLFVKGVHF